MLVDIHTHIHNTYAHTILQIIGAWFLLGLLAALVNYCTLNFGIKSPTNLAHPCYFQLRLTVLAGCLPCLGKPWEAQLSKDAEPSLSPTWPKGVCWGLSQVLESKQSWPFSGHFHREADQKNLDLWCTLWWRMTTIFFSCTTKWKERSLEKHECKNPQDRVSR